MTNKKLLNEVKATAKTSRELLENLKVATKEKGVEQAFWSAVKETFDTQISDAFETDGYVKIEYVETELFMLMEFKYDRDFNKRLQASKVLTQALFYMKTLLDNTGGIPNIVMIADQHTGFIVNTTKLATYLEREDVDWTVAASNAAEEYANSIVTDIYNDPDITWIIHEMTSDDSFQQLVEDIKRLTRSDNQKIKLNTQTISSAFDRFITGVLTNSSTYKAEHLVSIFLTIVLNQNEVFQNKQTRNVIVVKGETVHIHHDAYESFINHFDLDYKPAERRLFTENADRLIQDAERRQNGEFYTPSAFVSFAQSRLSEHLGDGWRDEFIVWDPAWGTGNLTRDNGFSQLYVSTLIESDLSIASAYNAGATKFQFDFLNDDFDFETNSLFGTHTEKLPKKLADTMAEQSNAKILFFMNPPYATGGNANSSSSSSKKDLGKTAIGEEMRAEKYKVSEQLYAQFLYRILRMKRNLNLKNVYIGLFSPSLFLTGKKYDKFRSEFLKDFEFVEGNLFQASNFADVSGNWAIDFSIWKAITPSEAERRTEFLHNILGVDSLGSVFVNGQKLLWNTDNQKSLQDFLIEHTEKPSPMGREVLQFSSRYTSSGKKIERPNNAVAYLINDTNNVEATAKGVYFMSSPVTRHIKTSLVTVNTFVEQMVVFAARKSVTSNWMNQKDEFLAPNVNHERYADLQRAAVIFSIFAPENNVISYRANYMGKGTYNLNPWSFVDFKSIQELANEFNNEAVYNDTLQHSGNSFVYDFIQENWELFTSDERELLTLARELIYKSFKQRRMFDEDSPEYTVNVWDPSWNQIQQVLRAFYPTELKEFQSMFSKFSGSISDLVYDVEILRER